MFELSILLFPAPQGRRGGGGGMKEGGRGGEMQKWPFLGKFIVERVTDAKAPKTPQFCFSSCSACKVLYLIRLCFKEYK